MSHLLLFIRQRTLLAALLAFVTACVSLIPFEASFAQRQPLPIQALSAGMHVIQAEIASNETTRARGLMQRKELESCQTQQALNLLHDRAILA